MQFCGLAAAGCARHASADCSRLRRSEFSAVMLQYTGRRRRFHPAACSRGPGRFPPAAAGRRKDNRTLGQKVVPRPPKGQGATRSGRPARRRDKGPRDQVAPPAEGIRGATYCPFALSSCCRAGRARAGAKRSFNARPCARQSRRARAGLASQAPARIDSSRRNGMMPTWTMPSASSRGFALP